MTIYNVTVYETNVWNRSVVADSQQEACEKIKNIIDEEGFEYFTDTTDRIRCRAKELAPLTYKQFVRRYHDLANDLFRSVAINELGGWVAQHIMLDIKLLEEAHPEYYVQVKGSRMIADNCWQLIEKCRNG